MPTACECTLTRTVIISTKNGEGSEKLISKQTFSDQKTAAVILANEKTQVYNAIKGCYGRGSTADDITMIGDIIVDANDIKAVGFRITLNQVYVGAPEPISDNGDPETK